MITIWQIALLIFGLINTLFIPGAIIIKLFFPKLNRLLIIPGWFLLSIFISTYTVYFISLLVGFSQTTIGVVFIIQTALFLIIFKKNIFISNSSPGQVERNFGSRVHNYLVNQHIVAGVIALMIFTIFLIALIPAIFSYHNGYYVMSAVNWQDTAMHMGIIQSISQGNFPPEAPYFSGQPLSYYYFIDLHTAILVTLMNIFFPEILILDNPFFVFIFALCLYVTSFYITQKRITGILTMIIGSFFGNWIFIRFFEDLFNTPGNIFTQAVQLLTNQVYTMEYGKLIQMVPMADYFLQNRPMMIGLPAVTFVLTLLLISFKEQNKQTLLLAGLITVMLLKFQMFAFGVCLIFFVVSIAVFGLRQGISCLSKNIYYFLLPVICGFVLFSLTFPQNNSLIELFFTTFSFGVWTKNHDWGWFLLFFLTNFGLPFLITVGYVIDLILRRAKNATEFLLIIIWLLMLVIPHLALFTIYDADMFKFFYFMVIPMAVITGKFLDYLNQKKLWFVTIIIIFVTCLTSVLTLVSSFLNKNLAYTQADYNAGIWIRQFTEQRSIFLSLPVVHSPATDIGGRLIVLSYTTWPYTHGFNKGEDNVFTREADIRNFYQLTDDQSRLFILQKYGVKYIYYGPEEKRSYPQAGQLLDQSNLLEKIYQQDGVVIYKLKV